MKKLLIPAILILIVLLSYFAFSKTTGRFTIGNEPPILALLGGGVAQTWKPFKRCGYFASIRERNDERVSSKTDVERENSRWTNCAEGVHTISPRRNPHVLRRFF